nr:hypothetical protein [Pandoravirus massiliensis]
MFAHVQTTGGCVEQDRDDGTPPPTITEASERAIGNVTVEAAALAALHGLTPIVRHLVRASRAVRKALGYGDRLAYNAANAQCLDTLIYAHDIQVCDSPRCSCGSGVGDAAWKSPRTDMIEWIIKTGCAGFVPLNADHAAHAIRKGHLDMLRFMQAHGLRAACSVDQRTIAHAVHRAARKGALDALTMVVNLDLYPTITPVLTGAAAHENDSVLRWALCETGPCVARWGAPDRLAVRAAAASAATADKTQSVEFLITNYADEIDSGLLMWYAISNDSVGVAKWLETRLAVPFAWGNAMPFAMCARSSRVLRYMIEDRRVPFDPLALVLGSSGQSDDILDLVCSVCTHDQLQRAVDVMAAVSFNFYVSTVRGIRRRVPTICVAQAAASDICMLATSLTEDEANTITTCECVRCVRPHGGATTAPAALLGADAHEPARKRPRIDGAQDSAKDTDERPLPPNGPSHVPATHP